jgi:dolichol-phosphate mannosyltransferase
VGISGIIVNEGLLAMLTEVGDMKVTWAGAIAIEVSIIHNFLLNNFWTWRDNRQKSFLIRFIQYHSVTLISGGINYLILIGFSALGMHHLIANLIGIAIGTVINFVLNHYWTFGG